MTLSQNLCVSNSNTCGNGRFEDANRQCQPCPSKCSTCVSAASCSTCATGFSFNGFDCVVANAQLQRVALTIKNVCRRDSTVFITIGLNIIPNGLSPTQRNNFFLVVPNTGDRVNFVNQWQ